MPQKSLNLIKGVQGFQSVPLETRFWRKVDKRGRDDCWPWTGSLAPNGYGQILVGSRVMIAHRASYKLFVGDIPAGLCICHKCDNRKCVNPNHLFTGTRSENMTNAVNKGRFVVGERCHFSKLKRKQVIEIKKSLLAGISRSIIASKYKIHPNTIGSIALGDTWKHVKLEDL